MKGRSEVPGWVEDVAADWFVRRRDGLSSEAEAKFQAWQAADPRHAMAIAALEETWTMINVPASLGRGREAARLVERRLVARQRRPYFFGLAGLAVAAALMLAVLPRKPVDGDAAASAGALAFRPNFERLTDGSVVELNADAEIAVEFTAAQRVVRLVRGEAHFAVAKNPTRPFIVKAGSVSIRAVGTEFAVTLDPREVGVLVTEGRVAVETPAAESSSGQPASAAAPVLLDAGRGVLVALSTASITPLPVQPMTASRIANALAWRGKRVEFTRMPLSAAVALFNQQNRVQLSIADESTGALPISGIFWSDDPDAFVRLLVLGLDIRAVRTGDTVVLSRR